MHAVKTLLFALALGLFAAAPAAQVPPAPVPPVLDGNYELVNVDGSPLHPDYYFGIDVTACDPSWGDCYRVHLETGVRVEIYTGWFAYVEPGLYFWEANGAYGVLIWMGTFWYSAHGTDPSKDRLLIPD